MNAVEKRADEDIMLYEQILDDCICLQIKKSARTLTNMFDKALLNSSVNSGQFAILLKIASLDSPTLNVLADHLNLKSSTMSRALSPLERENLIMMATGKDKRTRRVQLSDKGQATIKQAIPLWEKANEKVKNNLGLPNNDELNGKLQILSTLQY